jgi:hypothetical protein
MADSDPKITIERIPTGTNDEEMSNTVHEGSSDGSNSIPVKRLDYSKEGDLLRVSTSVLRDRASFSRF